MSMKIFFLTLLMLVYPYYCSVVNNSVINLVHFKIQKSLPNDIIQRMIDASSKIPSGVLAGNFYDLGNFDECYNIKSANIYGKYCLGTLNLNASFLNHFQTLNQNIAVSRNMVMLHPQPRMALTGEDFPGIHLALCVPDSIKVEEISIPGILQFSDNYCYSKATEPELSPGAIATIVILAIFLALMAASTLFDIFLFYTNQKSPHEVFLAFSVLTNGRKIFTNTTNPDQLLCLNGIKAISMMWVIIGHEYSMVATAPIANMMDIGDWQKDPANMAIQGATVSVDTFFVVGGLVTVYTYLKSIDKGVKFNLFLFYIHRYLRLTPALFIVGLVHLYLSNYLGNGPLWKTVDLTLVQPCKDSWWATLLYITNYVTRENCVPQTWYLTVDMQLYFLSPLILIPLVKWPLIALGILGFLVVAGVVVPFGIVYGLKIASMNDPNFLNEYYIQTYARFGPYVIGMILGYIIYKVKKTGWKLKLQPKYNILIICTLWFVSITGLVACVYAGYDFAMASTITKVAKPVDRWGNSLFLAFDRNAWAVALSIAIFLCVTGYGGPIDAFLSLPVFQFLTKLSYSMYLVHLLVISVRYYAMKNVFTFSNRLLMGNFWGDFMCTLFFSLILCLSFESPVIIIEKYLFGRSNLKPVAKPNERLIV